MTDTKRAAGIEHIGVAVVFACHDGEGNFLLSKRGTNARDEHGTWDPGGGAIEFGDSVEGTLRKEVQEEYCTDVLGFAYLGYRDVHREQDGRPTHWISLDFKVRVDRAKAGNGEPHKMDAVEWFTLDALPSPMHSQWPEFFAKYEARLREH